MGLLRLDICLKTAYKRRMFRKNAKLGDNFTCGPTASCRNEGKDLLNLRIGNHCEILGGLIVSKNGKILIGDYTTIRAYSIIGAEEEITIGDHVIISNHVTIYDNNNHPTDPEIRFRMSESGFTGPMWGWNQSIHKPIRIESNVWICQNCMILKGVTIGKGALVAAGAVVTKDVPPYSVAAGNPARIVKYLK